MVVGISSRRRPHSVRVVAPHLRPRRGPAGAHQQSTCLRSAQQSVASVGRRRVWCETHASARLGIKAHSECAGTIIRGAATAVLPLSAPVRSFPRCPCLEAHGRLAVSVQAHSSAVSERTPDGGESWSSFGACCGQRSVWFETRPGPAVSIQCTKGTSNSFVRAVRLGQLGLCAVWER